MQNRTPEQLPDPRHFNSQSLLRELDRCRELVLGFVTFWIFGLGFAFFSIAMICAVVAMCTNQVQRGLILLLSSFASLAICAVVFFVAIFGAMFGAFGVAAQKARLNASHPNASFGQVTQLELPVDTFFSRQQKARPSATPTP